jgi:hypothetical protein
MIVVCDDGGELAGTEHSRPCSRYHTFAIEFFLWLRGCSISPSVQFQVQKDGQEALDTGHLTAVLSSCADHFKNVHAFRKENMIFITSHSDRESCLRTISGYKAVCRGKRPIKMGIFLSISKQLDFWS